jgi:hypothetical protein
MKTKILLSNEIPLEYSIYIQKVTYKVTLFRPHFCQLKIQDQVAPLVWPLRRTFSYITTNGIMAGVRARRQQACTETASKIQGSSLLFP